MAKVIGIDLGTTNSCVAVMEGNTARVIVNRVWMHHFGEGFVRTPDDLGTQAEKPTHPELLDYLSTYLMEQNWSIKKLHRLIMLSKVYQEDSHLLPGSNYATVDSVASGSSASDAPSRYR